MVNSRVKTNLNVFLVSLDSAIMKGTFFSLSLTEGSAPCWRRVRMMFLWLCLAARCRAVVLLSPY